MTSRVVLAVALGSAAGAAVRALLGLVLPDGGGTFPWTTLAINVSGSFLLALLPHLAWIRRSALLPPLLGTGVLGGYTTLSACSEQSRALLAGGRAGSALLYLVGTLAACLVAVALAERLTTSAERRMFEVEEGNL